MQMLKNEDGYYPVLITIHRMDRTNGPDVLVRCVHDDTSLSSAWHVLVR